MDGGEGGEKGCLGRGGFGLLLGMEGTKLSEVAVVILGHGTEMNRQSAAPARQHAETLNKRGCCAGVRSAFWKQTPRVQDVLQEIAATTKASRIFIVPLFVSEGYFCTQVIPRELGFDYAGRREVEHAGIRQYYCDPVGTHPAMTEVIMARARAVVEESPFPRAPKLKNSTLIIAGHGTERHAGSREAIAIQVSRIQKSGVFAHVQAAYMEESPHIKDSLSKVDTRHVVVVPFFISDGLHVVEDIPVLLGEPQALVKERLATGKPTWRNPTEREGRLVWYGKAVGNEPLLADVIWQRVRETAGLYSTPAVPSVSG